MQNQEMISTTQTKRNVITIIYWETGDAGMLSDKISSRGWRGARTTLNARNVKTIVVAKTRAPHATCATVMPIIGFNGCGSLGDARRVIYVAMPSMSCTTNNSKAMEA